MPPKEECQIWPDAAKASARRSTFAGDLVIEGDVNSEGPGDVHRRIVGSAHAPEVVVAASGRIEGCVSAHDLSLLGFGSGLVSARHVQLAPTAVVRADFLQERVGIEAGAELEGRLQRKG